MPGRLSRTVTVLRQPPADGRPAPVWRLHPPLAAASRASRSTSGSKDGFGSVGTSAAVDASQVESEQTQRNIVSHNGVAGQVSMVLRKVTFEEALTTLLSTRNLTYAERGNVIHIMAARPKFLET